MERNTVSEAAFDSVQTLGESRSLDPGLNSSMLPGEDTGRFSMKEKMKAMVFTGEQSDTKPCFSICSQVKLLTVSDIEKITLSLLQDRCPELDFFYCRCSEPRIESCVSTTYENFKNIIEVSQTKPSPSSKCIGGLLAYHDMFAAIALLARHGQDKVVSEVAKALHNLPRRSLHACEYFLSLRDMTLQMQKTVDIFLELKRERAFRLLTIARIEQQAGKIAAKNTNNSTAFSKHSAGNRQQKPFQGTASEMLDIGVQEVLDKHGRGRHGSDSIVLKAKKACPGDCQDEKSEPLFVRHITRLRKNTELLKYMYVTYLNLMASLETLKGHSVAQISHDYLEINDNVSKQNLFAENPSQIRPFSVIFSRNIKDVMRNLRLPSDVPSEVDNIDCRNQEPAGQTLTRNLCDNVLDRDDPMGKPLLAGFRSEPLGLPDDKAAQILFGKPAHWSLERFRERVDTPVSRPQTRTSSSASSLTGQYLRTRMTERVWRLGSLVHLMSFPVGAMEMADAGWYYDEDTDDMCCYCCSLTIPRDQWSKDDNPAHIHAMRSPDCPRIKPLDQQQRTSNCADTIPEEDEEETSQAEKPDGGAELQVPDEEKQSETAVGVGATPKIRDEKFSSFPASSGSPSPFNGDGDPDEAGSESERTNHINSTEGYRSENVPLSAPAVDVRASSASSNGGLSEYIVPKNVSPKVLRKKDQNNSGLCIDGEESTDSENSN